VSIVVDASVALKWVIEEDGSELARRLVVEETLLAPDLLFIECANVLWVKAKRGLISSEVARLALSAIEATPIRAIPVQPLAAAALAIALELAQSAYDSLYLAVAMAERATFVTADMSFARAALGHPVYRASLSLLET
jgi:predicted nucleic acid-binding protein